MPSGTCSAKKCAAGSGITISATGKITSATATTVVTNSTTTALFDSQADAATKAAFYPHGFKDPYAIQQYDWLQAIEQGSQPETDGNVGLEDLAAAFAIIESSQLGRAVTLEEMLTGKVAAYQQEINEHYGL